MLRSPTRSSREQRVTALPSKQENEASHPPASLPRPSSGALLNLLTESGQKKQTETLYFFLGERDRGRPADLAVAAVLTTPTSGRKLASSLHPN